MLCKHGHNQLLHIVVDDTIGRTKRYIVTMTQTEQETLEGEIYVLLPFSC